MGYDLVANICLLEVVIPGDVLGVDLAPPHLPRPVHVEHVVSICVRCGKLTWRQNVKVCDCREYRKALCHIVMYRQNVTTEGDTWKEPYMCT